MIAAAVLRRLNGARLWRRRLRVWGHSVRASSLDRLVCLLLHRTSLMGKAEHSLLSRLVAPGMEVVDVGANLGLYTLLLAELAGPRGHVHAFEPEPALYRALRSNCRRNGAGNVTALNYALGPRPGRVAFFRSLFNSGDNRLGGLGWQGQALEVEQVRLDDVLPRQRVDFIKMDVQGYELNVLQGMDRVFRSSPEMQIYFEYWPHGLRVAGTRPEAVLEHLDDRGFRVYEMEDGNPGRVSAFSSLTESIPGRRFMNLLASRRPIRSLKGV